MGKSFEKLAFLFEECIKTEEAYIANIENYVIDFINTNGKACFEHYGQKDCFLYTKEYKNIVDKLDEFLRIDENQEVSIKENFVGGSIKECSEKFKYLESLGEKLTQGINNADYNMQILKSKNNELLSEEIIIKKEEAGNYNSLLENRLREMLSESYSYEFHLKVSEADTIVKKMELYNLKINSPNTGVPILNAAAVDYVKARELSESESNVHLVNFDVSENINAKNMKTLNDVVNTAKVNLLDDADSNIRKMIFLTSSQKYIIPVSEYFSLLQKEKIARGQKRCWICGERLGLFNYDITCRKHKEYEDSTYVDKEG